MDFNSALYVDLLLCLLLLMALSPSHYLPSVLSDSCFSHKTNFLFPSLALCMLVSSCFPSEHSTTFAHRFIASSYDIIILLMNKIFTTKCFKYFKQNKCTRLLNWLSICERHIIGLYNNYQFLLIGELDN